MGGGGIERALRAVSAENKVPSLGDSSTSIKVFFTWKDRPPSNCGIVDSNDGNFVHRRHAKSLGRFSQARSETPSEICVFFFSHFFWVWTWCELKISSRTSKDEFKWQKLDASLKTLGACFLDGSSTKPSWTKYSLICFWIRWMHRKHPQVDKKLHNQKENKYQEMSKKMRKHFWTPRTARKKKDSFDRVLGSFESPPGMNLRIDAGPINLAYGIPVIHEGCCIRGDAQTLRFGLHICDSHAALWVLTSHVFCITYCVMEWSSNSNEMCVGWWSSVIVGIPTHLRVLDYQIQLTSNSPQQQWTDRQRHEVATSSVSFYLKPSRCWNKTREVPSDQKANSHAQTQCHHCKGKDGLWGSLLLLPWHHGSGT